MWTHLSRIKMGIGMRGPGEKQLEVDKRLAEKKIYDLRMELAGIERRKERQVATRSDRKTVSLCGYTNAGKSTLMNRLTGNDEYAKDSSRRSTGRALAIARLGPVTLGGYGRFHSRLASPIGRLRRRSAGRLAPARGRREQPTRGADLRRV
jgi:hypothetical protein